MLVKEVGHQIFQYFNCVEENERFTPFLAFVVLFICLSVSKEFYGHHHFGYPLIYVEPPLYDSWMLLRFFLIDCQFNSNHSSYSLYSPLYLYEYFNHNKYI